MIVLCFRLNKLIYITTEHTIIYLQVIIISNNFVRVNYL